MSDEALNAHLDWLDKCAEEQINECVKHEFMCATNEYLKCKYCPKTMHPDEAEAILNEHAALKRENEHLSDLAYGPRHDSDCPALWGAGFCRCGLRDRIEEWKQKRAELDVLLESE